MTPGETAGETPDEIAGSTADDETPTPGGGIPDPNNGVPILDEDSPSLDDDAPSAGDYVDFSREFSVFSFSIPRICARTPSIPAAVHLRGSSLFRCCVSRSGAPFCWDVTAAVYCTYVMFQNQLLT